MSAGPVLDPVSGAVRLTRGELAALAGSREEGGADGGGRSDDPLEAGHAEAVDRLQPVLATIASASARALLRRWTGRVHPVVEVIVGPAGVVVLPGGGRAHDVQEPRWHPRPTAVARVLAELLDLPIGPGPAPLDEAPRPWSELVDAASEPRSSFALADLRWAKSGTATPASVLVLGWHVDGGIVELEPAGVGTVRARPRHPLEVWTGLTTLTRP